MTDDMHAGRELDLDIVSASWRSLSEPEGFDQMVAAWDRKLEAVRQKPQLTLVDRILSRQLASIGEMLGGSLELRFEDPLAHAVATTPAPAMVLSPEGLVVTLGDGAADYFDVEQSQRAGEDWLREDSRGDFAAVRKSAHGQCNSHYAIVRVRRKDGVEALAEVYTLQMEDDAPSYTVVRSLELDWYPEVSTGLAQAFGLTEAETEICRLVFRLGDLAIVAEARDVTLETVRTQMKRVFGKVEVSSKAELVRMLALLCARAERGRGTHLLQWSDPLRHETIIYRRDRRRLAYTWTGAEHGRPVLFIHGEIPYFVLHEDAREDLARRNIKLICLSNPGHGNSDPADHDDQLGDGCAAIEEFCDHLGLHGIPAVASSSGQVYLVRLARLRPELFTMLMALGMTWNIAGRWHNLPLMQKTLSSLAKHAPDVFDLACRVCYRMVKQEGPDFYLLRAFGEAAVDRRTIADPEFQPLLRAGCRHLISQGHRAFVREELMVANNPLDPWLGELQTPMHWLIPADVEDTGAYDLNLVKALNPLFSIEAVAGTGQLLAFQRSDLFVERLAEMVGPDPAAALQKHENVAEIKCDSRGHGGHAAE